MRHETRSSSVDSKVPQIMHKSLEFTDGKSIDSKEEQVKPEGLLIRNVPVEICQIGQISKYLETLGPLSGIKVSPFNDFILQ